MAMDPNPIPSYTLMSATGGVPLPFPTPTIAEVENHIVPAVNPSQELRAPQHPPYADMICTAIAALKEKDGSSKRAIAKFIEEAYSGLPATHSALLTHNLKRLKSSGHLVMVKKSYKLFRSDDGTAATANAPSQSEPQSIQPTRGRGRPPKNRTQQPLAPQIPQYQQPQAGLFQNEQSHLAQPQFQAQPQPQQSQQQFTMANTQQQYADPVLVALGLVDEPAIVQKRGPGRPSKNASPADVTGQLGSMPVGRKRGRPPGSKGKKAGRPPKPKSVSSIVNGLKRRPGRPRKIQPPIFPFAPATAPVIAPPIDAAAGDQGPNLPAMPNSGTAAPNLTTIPAPSVHFETNANSPRRRGRPRKYPVGLTQNPVTGDIVTGGPIPGSGRGRGRGRGRGGASRRGGLSYVGGYMKPKTSTGRPVGRPRKDSVLGTNATKGELSTKLRHFQSKVKEAVDVLKPNFTNESSVAAIRAIKDLELLATVDLNALFRDDTTQQPPEPPLSEVPLQPDSFPNPQ